MTSLEKLNTNVDLLHVPSAIKTMLEIMFVRSGETKNLGTDF